MTITAVVSKISRALHIHRWRYGKMPVHDYSGHEFHGEFTATDRRCAKCDEVQQWFSRETATGGIEAAGWRTIPVAAAKTSTCTSKSPVPAAATWAASASPIAKS
jgi:hypothetical protein